MIHALPNYGRIMQGIIPAHAYALGQMGNLVPQKGPVFPKETQTENRDNGKSA